jgi:hypothetical protein
MSDSATPRGTPEDYREFVRQMEAAAKRNSPAARAREWRDIDERTRARIGASLVNLASRMARQTGYRKPPLRYPQLPNVKRSA